MAGLKSIYFTDLDIRQGTMEGGVPVVDLPMSEKAGILADMITDWSN